MQVRVKTQSQYQKHKNLFTHKTSLGSSVGMAGGTCLSQVPTPLHLTVPQDQMEDMRKKEEHLEREMAEVSSQNRRLADPLQKARDEMAEMQRKIRNYERDKQILVVSFLLSSSSWHVLSWAQGEAHR